MINTVENIDNHNKQIVGSAQGEACNRNGCGGVLEEHVAETCCSCHINPPCSHCVDDRTFCPVCDWQGRDDQRQESRQVKNEESYKRMRDEWSATRDAFYDAFTGKIEAPKLLMRTESHTHFTQKVFGVFPKGSESKSSILPEVIGTFGGRFEKFTESTFIYVAYTD